MTWSNEILPNWAIERSSRRTLMLWWEGIPSSLRGKVWSTALTSSNPTTTPLEWVGAGSSGGGGGGSAATSDGGSKKQGGRRSSSGMHSMVGAYERAIALVTPVDATSASEAIDKAFIATPPPPELFIFSNVQSPLKDALISVLACVLASHRTGAGPPPPPAAPLLGAMLLLYMEEPKAYTSLASLAASHCVGERPLEHDQWRLTAAERMISRELPQTAEKLNALEVPYSAWLPNWHLSLFTSTLQLDTAARVWDCYLRDGEPLLWRVTLSLLKLLSPKVLSCTTKAECLELLCTARSCDAVNEKALFASLAPTLDEASSTSPGGHSSVSGTTSIAEDVEGSSSTSLSEVWIDLNQRLPVPSAEEGAGGGRVCYDLWGNSIFVDADEQEVDGGGGGGGLAKQDSIGSKGRMRTSSMVSTPTSPRSAGGGFMAKAKAAAGSRIGGNSASGGGRPRAATEGSGSPPPPRAVTNNDEEGKKGGLVGGLVSKLSFPMKKKK